VRSPDGTWSTQGLLVSSGGEKRQVVAEKLSLRGGELHVVELAAGAGKGESVALRHIDVDAQGLGADSSSVKLDAAFGGQDQNVHAKVDLSPGQKLAGSFQAQPIDLRQLRGLLPAGLDEALTGGRLEVSGKLATAQDGALEVHGRAGAPSLVLRGQQVSGTFVYSTRLPKGAAANASVALSDIRVRGPGIDLGGKASLSPARRTATFDLDGPLLDLDALLAALPPQPPAAQASAGAPPLPESMRDQIRSVTARGRLRVERMVVKKLTSQHVVAEASLARGVLTLSRADADLYGGTLDARGTTLDLTQPQPSWELTARLGGMDLSTAMQQVSGASPVLGRFTGQIHLKGTGDVWQQLRTSLTGKGSFTLANGKLTTASLEQSLALPLADALKVAGAFSQLGRGGSGAVSPPAVGTELRNLSGSFTVQDGFLRFSQPVTVSSSFGELQVGGAIGLDQRLDLKGTAKLSPQFVARATGLAAPKQAIDAPLQIGGTLAAPQVSVDSGALAKAAVGQFAPPTDELEKGLKGLFPGL
jgi:AsmA protein